MTNLQFKMNYMNKKSQRSRFTLRSITDDFFTLNEYPIPKNEIDKFEEKILTTYGVLTVDGLKTMFKGIDTRNKIFYDLGCGGGRAVIISYINHGFKKAVGVELSESRLKCANSYLKKLNDSNLNIRFYENDILNVDFSETDIIYVSNLCFPKSLNKKLGEKIDKLIKSGAILFVSTPINITKAHRVETIINVKQSWSGNSLIYKYTIL